MAETNRQILLKSRPPGEPGLDNFELADAPMPVPGDGEVLVRSIYLSLDPYMRGRMRDVKSYVPPAEIGAVMPGAVVGEVMESHDADYAPGDIVEVYHGWQEYAASPAKFLRRVDATAAPISTALGVLGMPGVTAFFGLLDVGRPKPGETVLVSAASGAVGGVVGQIAKIKGCRAVGIAGGPAKSRWVTEELGFDACIDYRAEDLDEGIQRTCPDGVDVYYDNVGGRTLDAVLRRINDRARIVICGMISEYNLEKPELAPRPTRALLVHRARMEGLIVFDYVDRFPEALASLADWVRSGELKYRETIADGIENAPAAFIGLLKGENFGKQLVRLGPEPA
ncbi:MAG: NADP-dependent oxidoreductase [Alphaproteobacteria bacterium]|nr:NADP-dependent oxidoreductase [Alphaproteobacteria bacterium]